MSSRFVSGLHLHADPREPETEAVVSAACERSLSILNQCWGLAAPPDCHVYVMTSWPRFLFQSAPGLWKAYLVLVFPWLALRASALWPVSGGWSFSYGRRVMVGIKPARLVQAGDRSPGDRFFTRDRDPRETVETITCHELVHACTAVLRLPGWLHEGLATLAMEYYLDRRIFRPETLDFISHPPGLAAAERRQKNRAGNQAALLSQFARGYWLTRWIDETRPELIKALLSERRKPDELEEILARACAKDREQFWREIDGEILAHFRPPTEIPSQPPVGPTGLKGTRG